LIDSCRKPQKVIDEQGVERIELVLDTKKVNYKTQLVNSPHYSSFVYELENFANLAIDCYNFMSIERANVLSQQILRHVDTYGYSIDAKSSETIRDHQNSQKSLTHILTDKKMEKTVTLKEEAGRSLKEALGGKEKRETAESI